MHARWPNSIVLLLGLAAATGCMTRQTSRDPLGFGPPQDIENSDSEAAGKSDSQQRGKRAGGAVNDSASAANRSHTNAAEAGRGENSARSDAVPSLGTAHAGQQAANGPEAAYLAKQQAAEEQEQALLAVVTELEAMGELDAETKRQLIADLRETKPAFWQPVLSIYRLVLARHKRRESNSLQSPEASRDFAADERPAEEPLNAPSRPVPSTNVEAAARPRLSLRNRSITQTLAADHAGENLAQRSSRLQDSSENSPADRSLDRTRNDPEVQPVQYEEPVEDLATRSTLPLHERTRAVRLAQASSAKKPAARPTSPAAEDNGLRKDSADISREEELADWHAYLKESILLLEEDTEGPARTAEEVRLQAELRLLYLAGGDREAALRPIDGISTTQQEFWSESLFALATYLDSESMPDGPRRAAEARRHLDAAITHLGELSTLGVRNIAFCSKVNSYGIYETYPQDVFAPGQQVLLYVELENFKCEETPTGFVTSVRSSYQIFDARGVRVESHDFATTEETCRNRRRDFFMRYFIDLPERIYDGEYKLKITIEDMQGQTSGEATIPFTIKEPKK
jgi:hypothetical protein